MAAILLIHLFATPEWGAAELLAHAVTIGSAYVLGFLVAYGLMLWLRARSGRRGSPSTLLLAVTTTAGLAFGLAILAAGRELLPIPNGVHAEPDWLLRLMPVGAILIMIYLMSEQLQAVRRELAATAALASPPRSAAIRPIELNSSTGMVIVDARDIALVAAQENYCELLLTTEKRIQVRSTLSALLHRLGHDLFARSHRSFAVNLGLIERVVPHGRSYRVYLTHVAEPVPVGRRYLQGLADAWRQFRQPCPDAAPI